MVTDPVEIPAGVYRVTVTNASGFVWDVTTITGDCDEGFVIYEFVDNDGVERDLTAVYESDGCTAVFEITRITSPYTMIWQKLD